MIIEEDDYLAHYGILRRSGRYPWGSGGPERVSVNPNKRNKSFLDYVDTLRDAGLSEVDIAKGMGISTTALRAARSNAKSEVKQAEIIEAQRLKDKGYSNVAIGIKMNKPESTVRSLLAPGAKDKADILESTTNMLKAQVAEKKYIDVGAGVEYQLGISSTKLNNAVARLREEGYNLYYHKIRQLGTGKDTNLKVLTAPETSYADFARNKDQLKQIMNFSNDGGRSYFGLHDPLKINPARVEVRYKEQGGDKADGVIFVRPGVADVSLGNSRYAQVRVSVGNGHYLKGMAMYKDDLPDGVDLLFNTNKSDTGNKLDAMKEVKRHPDGSLDKDNPYGAQISRQLVTKDSKGKEKVTSAMNIVNEEGDWTAWSRSISTQVLSKQSPTLAKTQLNMTYERRLQEFERISKLTNPTVRKKLLETFGDETDSASVHLKAASLPRTHGHHVILPIDSMPPTQIYAPKYRDGERVVLIRHPHGGTFEIPELTVNNNHPESKRLLGGALDAVGIHHSVAERLSGADFDGDTVIVIPNNSGKIKTTPALKDLQGFDPRSSYPAYEGMKPMSARTKQIEMGKASNLITDMTIKGASSSEIARAVKHSMVVIDAEKHNLNYKQSELDNGISQLKVKYQGGARSGASTLVSRATSEQRVLDRRERRASEGGPIDRETGKRVFEETGASYVNAKGETVFRKIKSQKLAETDDAHTLSSGQPIERVYADYSNRLKALANQARRESVNTPRAAYSPSARKVYATEVSSLNAKLNIALRNAPLERQAQVLANAVVRQRRDANPDMDDEVRKKIESQALNEARARTGAKKEQIRITQEEWNAIQQGAISDSKLRDIIANADIDVLRELATPKRDLLMSSSKINRATDMLALGYTRAEVADQLGVSLTTLDKYTTGEG